jgi:hypothetical protein
MRRFRARPSTSWSALLTLLVSASALAPGCSRPPEPSQKPLSVVGQLTIGNEIAPRGWIEFQPIEGNVGLLRCAPIRPDGTFHATRIPAGRIGIRFVPASRLPTYGNATDSALRQLTQSYLIHRTLDRDHTSSSPLKIDLLTEAMRFLTLR